MNPFSQRILFAIALLLNSTPFRQPLFAQEQKFIIRPEFSPPVPGDPYNLSKRTFRRPKVGLVLSGGGARGIAHIGVLKTLEKHNVPIDFIVGNSMGGIVGGLYAAGYSVAELESIVLNTDWTDVLSLTEDTRRSELYLDQKQAQEHSFLLIRLDGLQPIIPSSLSSGQRLTNFLTSLTLQGLYHPNPGFDDLKIPFRAVATDLISGQRVILGSGSLAEALRATVTVPLLFAPLERESMLLVDGGLVSNAPVDVARSAGCDLIISSNTTSVMRTADQLNAPWETADQIMSIMMQSSNQQQLSTADIVLAPNLGNHLSSEFTGLDSLIRFGEEETERHVDEIQTKIDSYKNRATAEYSGNHSSNHAQTQESIPRNVEVSFEGDELPDYLKQQFLARLNLGQVTVRRIRNDLEEANASGEYADLYADVTADGRNSKITFHATKNAALQTVIFKGNTVLPDSAILRMFRPMVGKPTRFGDVKTSLEGILSEYRENGYSLVKIDSLNFNQETGELRFLINEGFIQRVVVEGNTYTSDYVIRREFSQSDGELFNIKKAQRGIVNINSTGLFEYVLLDTRYEGEHPLVILKVKEKSTNNLRLGIHADNERSLQGLIDIRDANLLGSGQELGFTFATNFRSRLYRLEYRANRIFNTILTFNLWGHYRFDDVFTYDNSSSSTDTRFERISIGEYRQTKFGATLAFGAQLGRFGILTTEFRVENQEIKPLDGIGYSPEQYKLISLKLGTTFDTENRFPFPTSGMMLALEYESAMRQLGSQVSFGKLSISYENYASLSQNQTLRPKITVGVGDATLPLAEQFSLGGINSFFGLREDDTRGRQLFLANVEYRYRLPFKVVFDSYVKFRYDLGMISSLPEEMQFSKFHHGIGAELALDTPIGPASFGVGKSFFVRRELRDNPISTGPALLYFSIGYGM